MRIFRTIISLLLLISCGHNYTIGLPNDSSISSNEGTITVISDNDSIRLYTVQFPSANEYIPGKTEIWYESNKSGDKYIIVASNPDC